MDAHEIVRRAKVDKAIGQQPTGEVIIPTAVIGSMPKPSWLASEWIRRQWAAS